MAPTTSLPRLLGRRNESDELSSLVAAAKAGRSQVLVLRGEAGIGKTALLEVVLERAVGCHVARASGVESEMELAFASLHQLCSAFLDRLDGLPAPQRDALGTAFGLRSGSGPDRFLIGLAVLTLFADLAEDRPLVCVVDDAQWLDQASAQVLEFVSRRLAAERVALVFAVRDPDGDGRLAGLPDLQVAGLGPHDAAALLQSALTGPLDPRVRERILAESHGNPLALLELPRGLSTADLAFGGDPGDTTTSLSLRLERTFLHQVELLPPPARRLLLTASAEPVGDVPLLWRAADLLGIEPEAATTCEAAGLIELRDRIRFRHPLVRSAVYRSATPSDRRKVHAALAEVTDPDLDPDRRAWHRACAATGPDEVVAAELERSADRALAHGGLAAAAAFLDRATALTPDPARRTQRALQGAQAKVTAGQFAEASSLLTAAALGSMSEADRARRDLLLAQMSFAANRGNEALPLLLEAAQRLEPLDPRLARTTYLDALAAALFAGRFAAGPTARHVAEAARSSPPAPSAGKGDVLLDGLAVRFTDGFPASVPACRRAVRMFTDGELSLDEALRSAWLAASTAVSLWDDAGWDVLTRRHLQTARGAGALSALPLALTSRVFVHLFTGDLTAASSLVQEIQTVSEVTGGVGALAPYGEACLAAVRGEAEKADRMTASCLEDFLSRGEGVGVNMMQWARAVLHNGQGRYEEALRAARDAAADPLELGPPQWALVEMVEAGVRSGDARAAAEATDHISAMARSSATDWVLGVEAASRALLSDRGSAEDLYREAIERLGRTSLHVTHARTRLLYGEWLRREGRRVDGRTELRAAHETLSTMGVRGFAERARHELLATGETVRKRTTEAPTELTPQETHIAQLVAQGLTNPEIGAALFISARTVEWHLRKIFAKVGVATRRELRRSMVDIDRASASA
ncbi:regulatory LuxR family protein [Geodermatophilus tzadiensis]|uniref:Regulatory LuxR family protein n=2 Tax=Geodermatophilus tzadiensis TaxID=1137988 RepID=A0A2T0TTP2_9ACTN|nr:regulatory LuxR family protein [Geodermatophilus tzadiensis]